ncbi:MAG: FlgD immunoglobulin-like domain containing protein [Candidatus Krumholzibacteriia bacterium]
MKWSTGIPLACLCGPLIVAGAAWSKPLPVRHELAPTQASVDIVGDVDGGAPRVQKAFPDTIWIADWTFDDGNPCNDAGWIKIDNRIVNDGQVFWSVHAGFDQTGGITGKAAVVGNHDLCWVIPDGYDNDWYQAIRIEYSGSGFLSFDYLVDSEAGFDFMHVEIDSGCASFDLLDYSVDPIGRSRWFRQLLFSDSGLNLAGRVDSLSIGDFGAAGTHCLYIVFLADGGWAPSDGLVGTTIGNAMVIDNIELVGVTSPVSEDFEGTLDPAISFANMQDNEPFGEWARLFPHATDNDLCTENRTCSWIMTDDTTPTIANDPSMAFGPGSYVIRNWLDDIIVSPWVSLTSTAGVAGTIIALRRFPGNTWSTSLIVAQWSVRGKTRIANTDTPAPGDSIDCISSWGHAYSWNSLSVFRWLSLTWDMSTDFDPSSHVIQVRHRVNDWQWIAGHTPRPHIPGPGPYTDRTRIGRLVYSGPAIDEGIDARSQAQDAFPTEIDPTITPGTGEHFRPTTDRFGTTAFSNGTEPLINSQSPNLITGDSVTVAVQDVRGAGGITSVEWYGAIVCGPHAGKAPPPWTLGANGFFAVPADSVRDPTGAVVDGHWFVDLVDDYFRGGDVLCYFWLAADVLGGVASDPRGLTEVPGSLEEAQQTTGGLLQVDFLPAVDWDPGYLARIAADPSGKLEPTAEELANSTQANCFLYYQNVNARRLSGDANRTSFMYTLDRLGYRGSYDVYDHQGLGNTNNQLGGRATVEQATGYALLLYDAGNRAPGDPILPDGSDPYTEKIDQGSWFRAWLAQAATSEAGTATLWILGSNVLEEKPTNPLYSTDMGLVLVTAGQAASTNPDVEGQTAMTFANGNGTDFTGDLFSLQGGCPGVRDYDALDAAGPGVVTHRWKSSGTGALGDAAIVMNADPAGSWNTILMSFPWFDIRDPQGGPSSPPPEEELAAKILGAVLPSQCIQSPHPTSTPDPDVLPGRTSLHQNVPNPFNPMTEIRFDLARAGHVELRIYDVAGRLVRTLTRGEYPPGIHRFVWDGHDDAGGRVASGVYLYRLEGGDFATTRKLILMR